MMGLMNVLDWYRLFTWLALTAQAGVVALVGLLLAARFGGRARRALDAVAEALAAQGLALAAFVAWVATLGSLYLSEGGHLVPCRLCWFQRIAMYPLAILLTIAAARRDWGIRIYALTLAALGAFVSVWHVLVEWQGDLAGANAPTASNPIGWIWLRVADLLPALEGVGGKCDPFNPCSARPLPLRYGYISIPLMAGTAFVAIILVLAVGGHRRKEFHP